MGGDVPQASHYRQLPPGPGLSREKVAAHQRARLQQAMVELVAAYGYENLTVRGLAKRARISSGTFYTHYRGTDDCLLSAFDLVCRRTAERLVEAGRNEADPNRRLEFAVVRLFEEMVASPEIVTFMLRAAPAAGPAFASGLRNSATRIGAALEFCMRADGNPAVQPLLLEGMVAGLARIGRVLLPTASDEEIRGVAAEAVRWIRGLSALSARNAKALIRTGPPESVNSRARPEKAPKGAWGSAIGDERSLILVVAFRAARRGYHQLSIRGICSEAGVSRRNFNRYFKDLEHCYIAALEDRARRAIATALHGPDMSATWGDTISEALRTLGNAIEADREGARALLVEITAAGTSGVDSRDRLISQVARTVRAIAPRGQRPSELAAEASAAAAWTISRRRVQDQSAATTAALPVLSLLVLAPVAASDGSQKRDEIRDGSNS